MIHQTANISLNATIGKNVSIGPFTTIHDGVVIGDNCKIDGYCELGYPSKLANSNQLIIGDNSIIRSHSVFYIGSTFKEGLQTGHHVTVRENTHAGCNLLLGTYAEFMGDCIAGDYVKIYNSAHISKLTTIGNFVWIFPFVITTNDPTPPSDNLIGVTIEDYAVIATKTTLLPGVKVGKHALIGAHSCVTKDIPEYVVATGIPAKKVCLVTDVKLKDKSGNPAYPWPERFHRGYSEEVIAKWQHEFC